MTGLNAKDRRGMTFFLALQEKFRLFCRDIRRLCVASCGRDGVSPSAARRRPALPCVAGAARLGMIVVGAGLMAASVAGARDLYVSPKGAANGNGSKASPLDIFTAISRKSPAQPGDTIWLLPGTYPAPEDNTPSVADKGKIIPKNTSGKRTAFVSELTGARNKPIILRAMPGQRVTLDGWMEIKGADAWYWGFEIADSQYTEKSVAGLKKAGTGTGMNVFGPRTKCINLDVHDGAMGFGFWTPAVDAEIYGCIIHDFGNNAGDRGHGHAVYTQNETGTKIVRDTIMFNGFGWNVHVYTEGGAIQGYLFEGNISFSAGMRRPGQVTDNYLFAGMKPMDRIQLIDNVGYHPSVGGRACVRLASYGPKNISGACRGNYIMGAGGLVVSKWETMIISSNTIWAAGGPAVYKPEAGDKWTVDGNTYICPAASAGFGGKSFDDFRAATGFDKHSRLIDAAKPQQNHIFIRPNRYEPGRGHAAVFNWEGKATVDLDLKDVLTPGARYEIHNVQHLYGPPVAAGTYDGKPVSVPMLKSPIAPEFDAFLVTTGFSK